MSWLAYCLGWKMVDFRSKSMRVETAKASGNHHIEVKTVIGYGSPNKQGTNAVHGAPLEQMETAATLVVLWLNYEPHWKSQNVYAVISKNMLPDRGASAYQT